MNTADRNSLFFHIDALCDLLELGVGSADVRNLQVTDVGAVNGVHALTVEYFVRDADNTDVGTSTVSRSIFPPKLAE